MKILVIHHFETMWNDGYQMYCTSFEKLGNKLIAHIKRAKYDRVILTRFEDDKFEDAHYDIGIHKYVTDVYEYAYGWEPDMFESEDEGKTWVKGGYHSKAVYLPDFLWQLKNQRVRLCGAFNSECIEDMEIALRAVGAKLERLDKLIVG